MVHIASQRIGKRCLGPKMVFHDCLNLASHGDQQLAKFPREPVRSSPNLRDNPYFIAKVYQQLAMSLKSLHVKTSQPSKLHHKDQQLKSLRIKLQRDTWNLGTFFKLLRLILLSHYQWIMRFIKYMVPKAL